MLSATIPFTDLRYDQLRRELDDLKQKHSQVVDDLEQKHSQVVHELEGLKKDLADLKQSSFGSRQASINGKQTFKGAHKHEGTALTH